MIPEPPRQPAILKRLPALVASVPREADFIVLGDSLAAGWPLALLELAVPQGTRIFNFGLPGERVQNTLWRLEEIDTFHLRPHTVLILLGTNNLGDGDPAPAILCGLTTTAAQARTIWADPRVIFVTISRRDSPTPKFREVDRLWINHALGRLQRVDHLNADQVFSNSSESVLENDALHLSLSGYTLLSAALARLMTSG